MKRANSVADALNTGSALLDFGGNLPKVAIPLDGDFGGEPGPPGAGVPAGGEALQVVRKNAANTTTEWADVNKSLIGLHNVDNTSDVNKPVSNATQIALGGKADKTELSTKADLVGGKIPVAQLPATGIVTDSSVAAQVNSPETGAEIDGRITTRATPLVQPIVADYIASSQVVVDAAAAAVDANPKIAELEAAKWLRGTLSGTVSLNDLVTPGYYAASQAVANTFSPALPEAAQGPGILEVLYSGPSYVIQRWTAIGTNMARKWERQKFGAVWSSFRPVEWVAGFVPDGSDWNTVTTPGLYTLDSFSKAATMKNLPPTITSTFAGTIEVLPINADRVIQRATEYATRYAQTGRTWTRTQNNTGTFPEWEITSQEDAPQRASLTTIGDSLTAGGDIGGAWSESEKWPTILAGLIPATVRNLGRSGDTTDEMMLRLGIYAPYFTAPNIPASGSVVVTTTQKFGVRINRPFAGILAGVVGTLTSTGPETWEFTRTTAGSAVPITGPVKFVSSAAGVDSDTLTLWMGRNDFSYGSKLLEQTMADHVVASHARVLEWMRPRYKHVMIAGVTTAKNEKSGSVNHTAITEVNTRLRTMFPGKFADVQRYLVNDCLSDAGLTPTAEDLAATAAGEIPPQLYAPNDDIHFSKTTAATLASHFFAPYLLGKGWV